MVGTDPSRRALRLAVGAIVVIGIVAGVWLMGALGFRLGFANLLRVRELEGGSGGGGGLVTGTLMLIAVPGVILEAGLAAPGWLTAAFVLAAVPAAGIAGTRSPALTPAGSIYAQLSAVAAALSAAGLIWWTGSAARLSRIGELPFDAREAEAWLSGLQGAAGLDVLAAVAAAVWAVLVMRLAIPGWMRALVATACFFALAVTAVAAAASNAAAAEVAAPRPVVFVDDESLGPQLLLGYTPGHAATLRIETHATVIELHAPATKMTVIGRESITGLLRSSAPAGPAGR